jgi:beta-lactamase class A
MYIYDSKFQGLGSLSAVEPFIDRAYGPEMVFDQDRTNDLTDAIRGVKRTLSQEDRKRLAKVAFAIAKLGTGGNHVRYAGEKENHMFFSASLLKVALLYASFELRARLNKLAPTVVWD